MISCLRHGGSAARHVVVPQGKSIEKLTLYSQRLRPERGAKSPRESARGWGPASSDRRGHDATY